MRRQRTAGRAGSQRFDKSNRPPASEAWFWITRRMLESPAWQAMPLSSRKVVERIMLEHMAHAGTENGNLIVTQNDFAAFGIRRPSIAEGIKIAQALGLIDQVVKGGRSYGPARRPSSFALTWLPRADALSATNRWDSIKSAGEAAQIVAGVTGDRRAADRAKASKQQHPKRSPTEDIERRYGSVSRGIR